MKVFKNISFRGCIFFLFALVILNLNCEKKVYINPFSDATTLDCRNLFIRNVELKDSIVQLTLENTCKDCKNWLVYQGIAMISRQNINDTLAKTTSMTSYGPPNNGEKGIYKLEITKITRLPDLKTVQFDFSNICRDITYLPD